MTRRAAFLIGALALSLTGLVETRQDPLFRAVVDAVNVSVSVRDRNRPVASLKASDFELLDNGVLQEITSTSVEALPVDITLVLDTSASLRGEALLKLKADVQKMADLLDVDDRVRLMTFGTTVSDLFGLRPGGTKLPLEEIAARGYTSFYHALAAALMLVPDAERPQLVFAFSDGIDTASFLGQQRILDLAPYSSVAMYIAIVPPTLFGVRSTQARVPGLAVLQQAAARTGGLLSHGDSGLPGRFRNVLEDFRTSYVLRYQPRGVARPGWHEIIIRTHGNRPYDVHARKGYQGG